MGKNSRIIRLPNPRKQHVISELHLKRFEDSSGDLYVFEKGKNPRKSTAANESTQRDYFECKLPGHETNFAFEKKLSKFEAMAGIPYSKLIDGVTLNNEESAAWAIYVASTFLRSKKIRHELSPSAVRAIAATTLDPHHMREEQWRAFQATGRIYPMEEIKSASEKAVALISDPALGQITSITFSTPRMATALGLKRWQVVAPAPGFRFATSDAPVVTFAIREGRSFVGPGWGFEDTYVAMPLDPEHLFVASPRDLAWISPVDEANTLGFIGTMAQFSYRNIYASTVEPYLQELMDQHSGTVIFGRDAYRTSVA